MKNVVIVLSILFLTVAPGVMYFLGEKGVKDKIKQGYVQIDNKVYECSLILEGNNDIDKGDNANEEN